MDTPDPSDAGRTIIDQLLALTFNLVRVNDPERPTEPVGLASGFVIDKAAKQYVLTAGHVARSGPWFWECPLDLAEGCLLVPMGPFMQFASGKISPRGEFDFDQSVVPAADFAWAPFEPKAIGEKLKSFKEPKQPITFEYYHGPLDRTIAPGETCVLAAHSRGTIEALRLTYLRRDACIQDLEFQSTNDKGHHVFKPAGGHQGHAFYRGASGAPIAKSDGVIVSMLIDGSDSGDEIWGQPLPSIAHLAGFDPTGR